MSLWLSNIFLFDKRLLFQIEKGILFCVCLPWVTVGLSTYPGAPRLLNCEDISVGASSAPHCCNHRVLIQNYLDQMYTIAEKWIVYHKQMGRWIPTRSINTFFGLIHYGLQKLFRPALKKKCPANWPKCQIVGKPIRIIYVDHGPTTEPCK